MTFPSYPEHKTSGAQWLGDVPAHWATLKIKFFASFRGGGTPSREKSTYWNGDIPWVSPKDMKAEVLEETEETVTEEGLANSAASLIDPGNVLIVVRSGILKHTIPVAINAIAVALNQDMRAIDLRTDMCMSAFFLRWVQGLNDELLQTWGKQGATVESIEHDYLANTRVPLPPLSEQAAIVSFLDRETGKIDALVAEQEKLIELLEEKRQAVISHAVTNGLDPNAPMKDSGIEWLGAVPAHWAISSIGRVCTFMSYGFTNPMPTTDEGPIMLTANDIGWGEIDYSNARRTGSVEFSLLTDKSRPTLGDVLLTKDGTLGRVAVHDGREVCINQSVAILRASKDVVVPEFLAFALLGNAYQEKMLSDAGGTTIKHIYITRLAKMGSALPPLAEQKEIVSFLLANLKQLDALISESRRAGDLLKEHRSALISAAVTGKIDVRGLVVEANPSARALEPA